MKVKEDIKLDFSDVLIEPQRSTLKSRKEVSLERDMTFYHSDKVWRGVPIISANMDTTGTFEIAEALFEHKMLTAIHKHYNLQEWSDFINKHQDTPEIFNHIMVSTGTSKDDFDKLKSIMGMEERLFFICIDIANGYSEHLSDFVREVRKEFPNSVITAGNVVTGNMTEALILAGADIVKVGIGPGSVCTTRKMTGIGYPQLSAIMDCQNSAHGLGGHVMADGGGDFMWRGEYLRLDSFINISNEDVIAVSEDNKTFHIVYPKTLASLIYMPLEFKFKKIEGYQHNLEGWIFEIPFFS